MVVELFAIVIGMLLGMFMGLLPGIGAAGLMLMLYPLLLLPPVDIWVLMCIYIGITNSGQYYGSVSACVFGVLGEPSSLPAPIRSRARPRRRFPSAARTRTRTPPARVARSKGQARPFARARRPVPPPLSRVASTRTSAPPPSAAVDHPPPLAG